MKSISAVLFFVFFVGVWLALQACALLTAPVATEVIGGAQLAIKGAELQNEIRKADIQEAIVQTVHREIAHTRIHKL
jgi:heme O synthase-like polyprenyltransferase